MGVACCNIRSEVNRCSQPVDWRFRGIYFVRRRGTKTITRTRHFPRNKCRAHHARRTTSELLRYYGPLSCAYDNIRWSLLFASCSHLSRASQGGLFLLWHTPAPQDNLTKLYSSGRLFVLNWEYSDQSIRTEQRNRIGVKTIVRSYILYATAVYVVISLLSVAFS